MAGFRDRWTRLGPMRLHDRHRCDGEGPPVVLLHGLAVSHRYLMPTARALAGRLPVVVPDLAGFGRSDKPPAAYDVEQHAACLSVWLDALGLGRACLVGHSFGAEVAARLAVRRPDLVAALVLAGPTCDPRARTRRALIGRWAADVLLERPWQAPILIRDVADAKPWRVWSTIGHSVANPVEQDLTRLPVRPLVLGGSRDVVAPREWRDRVAALSGGVSVTVPGSAHNVLTTSGRRCAAEITAYVRAPRLRQGARAPE
jgi:pimeloyl-ACP methyl ester carboxylesterase